MVNLALGTQGELRWLGRVLVSVQRRLLRRIRRRFRTKLLLGLCDPSGLKPEHQLHLLEGDGCQT